MLDSEEKEGDNKQAVQNETQENNQEIINNTEETKDAEGNEWKEKTEDSARNEPDCDEAGMQQDQEGTQYESGASDVPTDPSGIDGVQGLNVGAVESTTEEPKPKQTRARKPKKA